MRREHSPALTSRCRLAASAASRSTTGMDASSAARPPPPPLPPSSPGDCFCWPSSRPLLRCGVTDTAAAHAWCDPYKTQTTACCADFGDGHGCESGHEAGVLAALLTAVTVSVGLLHALCMPCSASVTHPHQPLVALRQLSHANHPPYLEAAPWCQPALRCRCLATNGYICKRMARLHAQAETGVRSVAHVLRVMQCSALRAMHCYVQRAMQLVRNTVAVMLQWPRAIAASAATVAPVAGAIRMRDDMIVGGLACVRPRRGVGPRRPSMAQPPLLRAAMNSSRARHRATSVTRMPPRAARVTRERGLGTTLPTPGVLCGFSVLAQRPRCQGRMAASTYSLRQVVGRRGVSFRHACCLFPVPEVAVAACRGSRGRRRTWRCSRGLGPAALPVTARRWTSCALHSGGAKASTCGSSCR